MFYLKYSSLLEFPADGHAAINSDVFSRYEARIVGCEEKGHAHVRKKFFDSRVVPVVPVTEDGDTADRWKEGFMVRLSADIFPRARGLSSIYPSFPSYPSSKMSSPIKSGCFVLGVMKGRKERVRKKRVCSFSRRTRHTRRWDGYDGKSLYEKKRNGTQTPNLSTVQRTIQASTNPEIKLLWENIADVTFVRDYRRKKKQPRKRRTESDEDFIEEMFSEVGMELDREGFHVV